MDSQLQPQTNRLFFGFMKDFFDYAPAWVENLPFRHCPLTVEVLDGPAMPLTSTVTLMDVSCLLATSLTHHLSNVFDVLFQIKLLIGS